MRVLVGTNEPTLVGHRWICHNCSFTCDAMKDGVAHLWGEAENFSHWIYEHPDGDRSKYPSREMHTSDAGGCYLTVVQPGLNEPRKL